MAEKEKKSGKNEKQSLLDDMMSKHPLYNEEDYAQKKIETISSGSLSLDMALGNGGYPRGSIIDVFGQESGGKSLLSIMLMAQTQKLGGTVVVWDAERSYSKNLDWMRLNGVDTKRVKFLKLQPTQGAEIGFNTIEQLVRAEAVDLIVIDSIPSLVPQAALNRQITEEQIPGKRAGLLTAALSRLVGVIDDSRCILMTINQLRANLMASGPYAPRDKETTPWALKHFSTQRLSVKRMSKTEFVDGMPTKHRVRVKVVKSKVSVPEREAEFDIWYARGVDTVSEVADILVSGKVAIQKGAWYYMGDQKYQGFEKFVGALRSDVKLYESCKKQVLELGTKIKTFGVREDQENEEVSEISIDNPE